MIPAGYEVIEGIPVADIKPMPKHVLVRWLKKTETKGGVLLPQNRQRAGFMRGQVLAAGPGCDSQLVPGVMIEFNGMGDKEWLGVQDPADRDTVFFTRMENVVGLVQNFVVCKKGCDIPEIMRPGSVIGVDDPDDVATRSSLAMVGTWILVRPDEMPGRTGSGLIVPRHIRDGQLRQQKGLVGSVLSAGGLCDSCINGDRIAFDASHATQIHLGDHNDEVALLIDNDDVIGLEETAEEEVAA